MSDMDLISDRETHETEHQESSVEAGSRNVKIDPNQLIQQFHKSMAGIILIGLGLVALQLGTQSLLPFALGALLVWLNMTMLAKGLGGVLNGEKVWHFLLLFNFSYWEEFMHSLKSSPANSLRSF